MKIISILLSILFISTSGYAACVGESPTWTTTPDYASVSSCVSSATYGDTINVSAGSVTWTGEIVITKGISLIGAGKDSTIIKRGTAQTSQFYGLISYYPDATERAANNTFRISGFTLDADSLSTVIFLKNSTASILNKIRIDNNKITNPGGLNAGRGIYISGTFYGVIHSNVFEYSSGKPLDSYGADATSWTNLTRDFGSANNIYYEDNTFIGSSAYHSAGQGGRYVSRYNTYSGATANLYPIFDIHGNQPTGYSAMVGEIYGNLVDLGTRSGGLFDHRGGQAMIFNNYVATTSTVSYKVREEYRDDLLGGSFLQHVTNSHYWNNRFRSNMALIHEFYTAQDTSDNSTVNNPLVLVENREFWRQTTSDFNGSIAAVGSCGYYGGPACTASGVGCGTLANRPATCTTGVAYWATDQSCSDLTGLVGAVDAEGDRPDTTYKITGTLYKCTSNNVWSAYYTPYTYPHPLRDDAGTPAAPSFGSASLVDDTLTINILNVAAVNDNTGFDLSCSGAGDEDLTFVSASGGTLTYTIDRAILQSEGNCSLDYVTVEDGIEGAGGDDLGSFTDQPVTNNSESTPPTVELTLTITGTGCSVISSPTGINTTTSTTANYDTDTVVTLAGYFGNGWSGITFGGDCASNGTVTMSAAKTCTLTCKEKLVLNWSR